MKAVVYEAFGETPTIQAVPDPTAEPDGVVIRTMASGVRNWRIGDRVTVPFVGGCGVCAECHSGDQQMCDNQFQPGFTHWGSFAQYVGVGQVDLNLVGLPEAMNFTIAASFGCRFITAYRGVVDQAVHGCGGGGLSAIMIGRAMGVRVIAIDVADQALAQEPGAEHCIKTSNTDVIAAVYDLTQGGAHLSIDALANFDTHQRAGITVIPDFS